MKKGEFKYRKFSKISIFVLIQTTIFLSACIISILSHNSIISFYSKLVAFTIMCFMIIEIIPVFIFNLIKSVKFKDRAFALCMVLVFIFLTYASTRYTSRYYQDISNLIEKNYDVVYGECTKVYEDHGRASHLDITIRDMEFDINLEYKKSIKTGEYYKIEYLPNTKMVFNISRSKSPNTTN